MTTKRVTNTQLHKIRQAQKFLQSLNVDPLDVFALQVIQDLNNSEIGDDETLTTKDLVEIWIDNEFDANDLILDVANKMRRLV